MVSRCYLRLEHPCPSLSLCPSLYLFLLCWFPLSLLHLLPPLDPPWSAVSTGRSLDQWSNEVAVKFKRKSLFLYKCLLKVVLAGQSSNSLHSAMLSFLAVSITPYNLPFTFKQRHFAPPTFPWQWWLVLRPKVSGSDLTCSWRYPPTTTFIVLLINVKWIYFALDLNLFSCFLLNSSPAVAVSNNKDFVRYGRS